MPEKVTNRWFIAAAGVVMQLALGAVYAWSVFRKPLSEEFDTSVSSVNLAFTLLMSWAVPSFGELPVVPRVLVTTLVLTPIMTYAVLPWVTRRLAPWLAR